MTDQPRSEVLGPGHSEWCPEAPDDDRGHCSHWYDCEPCHRCGDDTPDPDCDCTRCWAARFFRPGRFPDQTILADPAHPDVMGNCWQTCIAGILDIPLEEVPHFVQDHESMADVEAATRAWALRRGFAMVKLSILEVDANADFALTLLCGASPRGVNHAVIGRGTDVLHDPHPSKAGLASITDVFAFLPLDPAARPTMTGYEIQGCWGRGIPIEMWFAPQRPGGGGWIRMDPPSEQSWLVAMLAAGHRGVSFVARAIEGDR